MRTIGITLVALSVLVGCSAEPPAPTAPAATATLPYEPVGSKVTLLGEPATICIHGDGWGTNIWAGNANTSCEFVIAVHEELIAGLNATNDTVRANLRESISVTSPVTGHEYDLHCAPVDEEIISCTGGEGAAVYFY